MARPVSPRGGAAAVVQRVESNTGAVHSFSESEVRAYIDYFNGNLADDPVLKAVMPLDPSNKQRFFEVVKDGLLFVKLINKFFPGTVDETKVKPVPKNTFEQAINIDFGLAAAKQIGCSVVNIGAQDIQAATEHLVLGLTWQVIKACLLSLVGKNLDASKLLGDDPNLPPEQILLRWFNYHLRNAGHHRSVMNFTTDIQDAENYAVLLGQIAPDKVSQTDVEKAFREKDFKKRAELVLTYADRLGCRKFVTAHDIAVDPNPRLNLAFVATLFNAYPALGPTKEELADAKVRELQMKLNTVLKELEEVKLQKKQLEGELAQQKTAYEALSDQLRTIALKLSDSYSDKNELLKAKAAVEREMQAVETRSLSLMEQLRVASEERSQLERAAGDSSALVKNLTAQYEAKLRELTAERDGLAKMVQDQKAELATMRQRLMESETKNQSLQIALDEERRKREALEKKYKEMEDEFNRQRRAWEDDRARLLARIKELEEENAMLKARLQEELGHKFNYAQQVREKEEELEKTVEESDNAKSILLARIKQLEEDNARLRGDMANSLDKAAREKEDAMARAKAQKEKELLESELRRYRDLDKVRLLLTGNTKQGWLNKQGKGILAGWKQRYFVLKDNLLYWYEDEKSVTSTKPMGVLSCDEVRLYELEEKDVKKANCFQLMHETNGYEITLAAAKPDEMRDWITELRLAKKKKLGVSAAAKDTPDQRKAREAGVPPPTSPRGAPARSVSPQRK